MTKNSRKVREYFISYRFSHVGGHGYGYQVQEVDKKLKLSIKEAIKIAEKNLRKEGYGNPHVIPMFFKEMKDYEE